MWTTMSHCHLKATSGTLFGDEPETLGRGNYMKHSQEVQTCKLLGHDYLNHHYHGEHNEPRMRMEEDQS